MGEVVVFQHDPFEDLGFFAEVLEKQQTAYRVIRLFHDEMPAENWDEVKALIILGGPMNVDDEASFPFLRWEKRIIRAAIDDAVPGENGQSRQREVLSDRHVRDDAVSLAIFRAKPETCPDSIPR